MDDMSQFHEVFFEEAREHLETMEAFLLDYSVDNEPDIEALNSVFRAAHSIKGGSDIFGFKAMTGLTHVMENLLDSARNQELLLTNELITVLLETVDLLKVILDQYHSEQDISWEEVDAGKKRLESELKQVKASQVVDRGPSDEEGFGFFDQEEADDSFGFFDQDESDQEETDGSFGFFDQDENNLQSLVEANIDSEEDEQGYGFFAETESVPDPEEAKAEKASVVEPAPKPLEKKTTPPTDSPQKVSKAKPTTESKTEATSIRVETAKIDKLVNLVGELVITQSMLNLIGGEVQESVIEKMQSALSELERNTREIQEAVMSVRMLPISFVFNRFPRLVRDLSDKLEKKIDLVIEGGSTEIDKNLVEKISDPLTHLIRNSVDHGVERPEQRLASGKPEKGIVRLVAAQKGGEIVITVSDDGAGLNKERILNKAMEREIPLPEPLTDDAIWLLIFAPGFSTAAEVTDVSGRGVGMDVVKRNIEGLGGRVAIESKPGSGTTFEIRLPLTLAILDGMCVQNREQVFVIPLVNIVESIQPMADQIKVIKKRKLLWVRGEYWPLVDLEHTMYGGRENQDIANAIIVLVETSKNRLGIIVDGLVGQQQVVIKSLERHYRRVKGVAGATIMGDGSVALILDIESLISSINLEVEGELTDVITEYD